MDQEKEQTTQEYEMTFLVKEGSDILCIKKAIETHGGTPTLEGEVRTITLAYPIKKETMAQFGFVRFTIDPENMAGLNRDLELDGECLRTLTVSGAFAKNFVDPAQRQHKEPTREKQERVSDAVTNEELEKKLEEILN